MKSTQVGSLTLTSAHYIALFPVSTFCRLQPVSLTGLCIGYAHRSISPIQADGGNCDIRSLICWFHSRHTVSPNALENIPYPMHLQKVGGSDDQGQWKTPRMAGKGARCGVNWLCLCQGSSHPKRLMESVQLLLDGTHSQKIHVLYAKSKPWMIPLMTSKSGESLRPRINVLRPATLSMNHTPRRSRKC